MPTTHAGDKESYDAIVMGGGPAGASAATFLAARGHDVLVLERTRYPRFHIGESLVPYALAVYEKMGILDKLDKGPFIHKPGVEVSESGNSTVRRAPFLLMAEGQKNYAFNVERAPFDNLLLDAAAGAGAEVRFEAEIKRLIFDGERIAGVEYEQAGQTRQVRAKYVIDATGRAGLIARHFNLRRMNPRLKNIALFQQYENADRSKNSSGEGFQVLTSHEEGWVWCIPIGPSTLSIGTVLSGELVRGKDQQQVYNEHLSRAPRITASLEGARPVWDTLKTESDFCYHSNKLAGPGFLLVGDAGCFVDPLFSGGVYMSTIGGMKAAETVGDMLEGKDESEAGRAYENFLKTGYDAYFRLVYTFYGDCKMHILQLFDGLPGEFPFFIQFISGEFWGPPDDQILTHLRARRDFDTIEEPFEISYDRAIYPNAYWKLGDKLPTRRAPV